MAIHVHVYGGRSVGKTEAMRRVTDAARRVRSKDRMSLQEVHAILGQDAGNREWMATAPMTRNVLGKDGKRYTIIRENGSIVKIDTQDSARDRVDAAERRRAEEIINKYADKPGVESNELRRAWEIVRKYEDIDRRADNFEQSIRRGMTYPARSGDAILSSAEAMQALREYLSGNKKTVNELIGRGMFRNDEQALRWLKYIATTRDRAHAARRFRMRDATERGLEDDMPRVVHGVKGMKSTPFRKNFRNAREMDRWIETNGDDVTINAITKDAERSVSAA